MAAGLAHIKRRIRKVIRVAHSALASRDLPRRLAFYMHSLEEAEYPAFEKCVCHLLDKGYRFVHLEEFLAGPGSHLAFVSFDDNYRAWYQTLPLLERLGVPATFYINTLPLRVPLDSSEIRSIRAAGHAIGAHTHSHEMLTSMPRLEAEESILGCKRILEEILGETIRHFAYPFGMRRHFNRGLADYCRRVGFETVASATPGLQHGAQGPLLVNRTLWRLELPLEFNLESLSIDGRLFERLTGLSAVG
jgi:peptidoglycan/xylan/chitin deacetylase (PgdA/CDA1 family)